jgi:outer membrane protein
LKQCIEYALEHNLNVAQSQLSSENLKLTQAQNHWQMAPNLNGMATHAYNIGRRIDPFTNQFANSTVRSNNFYLSSQVTLFNGLQQQNTIRQGNYDFEASKFDVAKLKQDISLNVASAYLNVLFTLELLENAKRQRDITIIQRDRIMKLVEAGSVNRGNQYDIESQLATEDLNVVNSENQVNLAYLSLTMFMNLPEGTDFSVEKPEVVLPAESYLQSTPGQIYLIALKLQPDIKSAELKQYSANSQLNVARGTLLPQLTLSGSIGTGFSGLSKQIVGNPYITGVNAIGFTSGGDTVYTPKIGYDTKTTGFGKQFSDNVNKNIQFNLTLPIFNQHQSRTAINRAKIAIKNAELNSDIRKQNLEKTIQQAYADAKAAFNSFEANKKAVNALKESYRYAEQRYDAGAMNIVDYNSAKTKLTNAESNLLRAKFDLAYKLKVIDLYQGGSLSF